MKQTTPYPRISKGLARFLKMKKKTHFKQKDLSFDIISTKRYLQLFKRKFMNFLYHNQKETSSALKNP